jgi:acyl-CoA synthetase (AMP-forming)/AMP-acid ligase II
MSYDMLRALSHEVKNTLNGHGIGQEDRVAILLPNGPEMAACFITVAQAATAAPLNPRYTEPEYTFFLKDLNAKALIVAQEYDGPALAVARRMGVEVLRLSVPQGSAAGQFFLTAAHSATRGAGVPNAQDVALILHTSGTTSRPKIVPLTHANITASAQNIRATLALTPADVCLNIMPLFHIHGLVGALMSTLAAGGAVFCSAGFDALRFFANLKEANPTWYTAVPTMHQAILSRAARNADVLLAARLRFIRSSSAALPAPVMAQLSAAFKTPVLEAYGMTEAAHQMTSNPLPPAAQRPRSVGPEAGPRVRIAHEGRDVFVDGIGEVVIAGNNVTKGYENNAQANEDSFFTVEGNRWFRTGDQGKFDAAGYLHLTGRLKEIINRGGENISPLEVDSALLEHPDVAQAVTFALPHATLGEEVAAAVVLRADATTDGHDLRRFAATRLSSGKVPRKIVILETIPMGPTGKLQRIGLAQLLGLTEERGIES